MNLLSNLKKRNNFQKQKKRIGRGHGSGVGGHTSTRGNKGQKARTGGKVKLWYEGGQTPMVKRTPFQEGFNNINKKDVYTLNLSDIEAMDLKAGSTLKADDIRAKHKLSKKTIVKVLSKGTLTKKIMFDGIVLSKKALEKTNK